jgi:hypothetical protein
LRWWNNQRSRPATLFADQARADEARSLDVADPRFAHGLGINERPKATRAIKVLIHTR